MLHTVGVQVRVRYLEPEYFNIGYSDPLLGQLSASGNALRAEEGGATSGPLLRVRDEGRLLLWHQRVLRFKDVLVAKKIIYLCEVDGGWYCLRGPATNL